MAQLVIVGQAIRERLEAADFLQQSAPRCHDGAERKIQRLETSGLKHLAPKIGIDCYCLPAHGERRRISQAIKAIDQPRVWRMQRRECVGQEIRRHAHVSIADDENPVLGQALELDQF